MVTLGMCPSLARSAGRARAVDGLREADGDRGQAEVHALAKRELEALPRELPERVRVGRRGHVALVAQERTVHAAEVLDAELAAETEDRVTARDGSVVDADVAVVAAAEDEIAAARQGVHGDAVAHDDHELERGGLALGSPWVVPGTRPSRGLLLAHRPTIHWKSSSVTSVQRRRSRLHAARK
jgi:hypothetical protein